MENHLDLHTFEQRQRIRDAERARQAGQIRAEQAKPNAALVKLGKLMVSAGEALQANGRHEHHKNQLKRRRA